MKRLFYLSLILLLAACSKTEPERPGIGINYSITEEREITTGELWDTAYGLIRQFGYESYLAKFQGMINIPQGERVYKLVKITYSTKDEKEKSTKVSALIVYPKSEALDKLMLINHGTHMGMLEVPTNLTSPYMIFASTGSLCILPDNIGVGASSDHKELYLNAQVQGQTSIDALLAAYAFAEDRGLLQEDFKTYFWGYSQGGASTLASLREFQNRPSETQQAFNLSNVICGGGIYDLNSTNLCYIKDEMEGKAMASGTVLPLLVSSMFASYPDEMNKFKYDNFFTSWALSTGIPESVRKNKETAYEMLFGFEDKKFSEIMNSDYLKQGSEVEQTFVITLERQNLCYGWEPKYPVQFFHCNPDPVVPYLNMENAYNGLKNQFIKEPEVLPTTQLEGNRKMPHLYGAAMLTVNTLNGKYF